MATPLSPIVKWAQNRSRIDLAIQLSDVKDPVVEFGARSLKFGALGVGACGENLYSFELELFSEVDVNKCSFRVRDRNVEIILGKRDPSVEWTRLMQSTAKLAWLRVDFEKWNMDESEPEQDVEQAINKITFEQRMRSEVDKASSDINAFCRLAYLTIYNVTQAILFAIILSKLLIGWFTYGSEYFQVAAKENIQLLVTCQFAAVLEVVNPVLGVVKTGVRAPLLQVLGRNFVLFALIVPVKEFHGEPIVFLLFLFWSLIEVIRYPFYVLSLYRINAYVIFWLRYSVWLLLYPAGIICEIVLVVKSIVHARATQRWSYPLPNPINFHFDLSLLLVVILIAYVPFGFYNLRHMYTLRQRKIGGKSRKPKQP